MLYTVTVEEKKIQPVDNVEVALGNEADFAMKREANKLFVIRAGLFGDFDKDGNYNINYDVLTELLEVQKIITDIKENGYSATAKIGEFKIKFQVKLQEEQNYFLRADLFLIEDGDGIDMKPRKIETFVAAYSDVNNTFFRDNVKKEFNLVTEIEAIGKEMNNDEIAKLALGIKNKHKKEAVYVDMLMEVQAEIYTIRMIEVLGRAGELGEKILNEYRPEVEKQESTFTVGKKHVYTKMKEILDTSIKNNGGFEAIGAQQEVKLIIKDIGKVVNEYHETFYEMYEMMGKVPKAEASSEQSKVVPKPAAAPAKKPADGDKSKDKPKPPAKPPAKDAPKDKSKDKNEKGLFDDWSPKKKTKTALAPKAPVPAKPEVKVPIKSTPAKPVLPVKPAVVKPKEKPEADVRDPFSDLGDVDDVSNIAKNKKEALVGLGYTEEVEKGRSERPSESDKKRLKPQEVPKETEFGL